MALPLRQLLVEVRLEKKRYFGLQRSCIDPVWTYVGLRIYFGHDRAGQFGSHRQN